MPDWVAISFGALDVRADESLGAQHELIVTPVVPGPPLFLISEGADIWRKLVRDPVDDADLSAEEQRIVREMEQAGIAASDEAHPARVHSLTTPWLSSPFHELVYALLARIAEANSIDIVFIKGPTLHAQGLRDREHSGDVDCWVRPGNDVRLAEAMSAWGWIPAYSAFTGTRVLHSLTLRAGEWGSSVDVHSWFPGMALDPERAFAVVQEMSEEREFAGVAVRTPSRDVHAVISALHEVRPVLGHRAGPAQNDRAAETLTRAGDGVLATSHILNSDFALDDALRAAFPNVRVDLSGAPEPRDWLWRSQTSPWRAYVEAFKLVPLRQRPRVLMRVIWPTPQSLRSGPLGEGSAGESTFRLRIRRLRHGWRMLTTKRAGA